MIIPGILTVKYILFTLHHGNYIARNLAKTAEKTVVKTGFSCLVILFRQLCVGPCTVSVYTACFWRPFSLNLACMKSCNVRASLFESNSLVNCVNIWNKSSRHTHELWDSCSLVCDPVWFGARKHEVACKQESWNPFINWLTAECKFWTSSLEILNSLHIHHVTNWFILNHTQTFHDVYLAVFAFFTMLSVWYLFAYWYSTSVLWC